MRQTKQKEKLRSLLFEKPRHFKAEEVLNIMNREEKVISLATVYRQLDDLVKQGKLKKITFDNVCYYDSYTGFHHHFCCEKCGKIYDVKLDTDMIDEMFMERYDHQLSMHEIVFKGICKNCLKKEKTKWN